MEHEQFGEERLTESLNVLGDRHTAQDVIDAVTAAVRAFTSGIDIDDDHAALVMTATPPAGLRGV